VTKKITIAVIVVLVAVFCLLMAYANDISWVDDNPRTLNVSSEGPIMLPVLVNEIKTHEDYTGYDNETVAWMESLGNKYVWSSSDKFVIMDKWDSDKIPSQYVCDAYFKEIFSCNVLENHSLGQGYNFRDVLLVNHVEYIDEEIDYYDI
jgi:hypothetical protein